MTRPRHQSKVGERGVDFSCPRCRVAGVKNSIPVWGRTESGYICGKEKPWEVASRDDSARRCQESLTLGQPTRRRKLMRVIVIYDDHALVDRMCQKWFARFKSSNFDLEDEERPRALLKFEVTQPAILLRLKEIGMIRGVGNWVPCELKPRDVECRFSREKLLQRPKKNNNKERDFCIEL
ncbi:hypothetical protein LAZ67_12003584 [Cordylochernes scorpioides]|uniref:Mos1 transposase HTH domain-containing protein n=1 Tax=Cordylochernes scorpioides TaxID=51811 RepID=A0ABY6L2H8_9ARAC|nr:hypothetical protein LAZ67_12003584 [Cordylochernes scorpioides]